MNNFLGKYNKTKLNLAIFLGIFFAKQLNAAFFNLTHRKSLFCEISKDHAIILDKNIVLDSN